MTAKVLDSQRSRCGSNLITHRFASNLEQVANLLCLQVNSAFYSQRDGKWIVAYGLHLKA